MEDLGVTMDRERLGALHALYLACGMRQCDGPAQMRRYEPSFGGATPRF